MNTPIDAEVLAALLDQATWVRRLAGHLVRDPALAADLTQEAWLAALRRPPEEGLPVRPWLGQVLRNLVRMRFRGEGRRKERERIAQEAQEAQEAGDPRDAYLDSPEQLVARAEVRRTLISLVVDLEEPFRSTLLLRYYEGLDSAEIAARQGVPAGRCGGV